MGVVLANAGRENDRFANAPVSPVSRTEIGSTPMRVIPAPDPMDPR
jgi:hypothetical protein